MSIHALIVNHPHRFNFAFRSIENQTIQPDTIDVHEEIFPTDRNTGEYLAEIYQRKVDRCDSEFILITLGDYELPCQWITHALAYTSGKVDVYGTPYLDQRTGAIVSGLNRTGPNLAYRPFNMADEAFPDNAVFMETETAKKYKWKGTTSLGASDHFYGWMQQAAKDNVNILVDKTLICIHHKL
jgi:hypothetical protein